MFNTSLKIQITQQQESIASLTAAVDAQTEVIATQRQAIENLNGVIANSQQQAKNAEHRVKQLEAYFDLLGLNLTCIDGQDPMWRAKAAQFIEVGVDIERMRTSAEFPSEDSRSFVQVVAKLFIKDSSAAA